MLAFRHKSRKKRSRSYRRCQTLFGKRDFTNNMKKSEKINYQAQGARRSLFPTPVTEEMLNQARRKSIFREFSERLLAASSFTKPLLQRSNLPPGRIIFQTKAAEHFTKGKQAVEKFQYEKAVICFSKAILLLPEQAELHVNQGEAYIQLCDFQSAAECYSRACCIEPGVHNVRLAFIYYMQGQCLFDRGLFLEALRSFRRAAELKPDDTAYRVQSLACLTAAGRHDDCLEELNGLITENPSADRYVFRARVYKVINQISCCLRDVRIALELNPTCQDAKALLQQLEDASEEARQQAVLKMLSGHLQEALCLTNTALESTPRDERLYLFRGTLYRRLKEFNSAVEDLIQATELSDSVQEEVKLQLALTYNDFAVQCLGRGLYAEALVLLNKAIMEEKNLGGLYLNRGDCFFKQGDWCYALLDYQQAEEMLSPDEPALRLRLAVIHNTLGSSCFQDGCFQDAADMFSMALKYNPTVSRYYESRSKALRRIHNLKAAREDFICLLILDPDNLEIPPMLVNLFPGSTASELLSSSTGQEVRAELMKTIWAWDPSSGPGRSLEETLRNMTMTDKKPERELAQLSEAAQELRLCMNEKDLQKIAKVLLQVGEAVESFVPNCPVLHTSRTDQTSVCSPAPTTSTHPSPRRPSCMWPVTQT